MYKSRGGSMFLMRFHLFRASGVWVLRYIVGVVVSIGKALACLCIARIERRVYSEVGMSEVFVLESLWFFFPLAGWWCCAFMFVTLHRRRRIFARFPPALHGSEVSDFDLPLPQVRCWPMPRFLAILLHVYFSSRPRCLHFGYGYRD